MILGEYELGPPIGSGAMGSVHIAHERRTRAPVAVKRIHPKYADQKQTLRRFAIEVQTAARLRHPNIVSVIASGTEPRGTPYCVMEWVSGRPLSAWCRAKLPWDQIAWIIGDILDALAYAHARGVIHRDLKPENLLVENPYSDTPRTRLADFGIARLLEPVGDEAETTKLTADDRVLGTPAYLSPEQAQGFHHLIGPQTDLYAVGVMLFELVSGDLPFPNMPVISLLMAHAAKPAPPLDITGRGDIPREVVSVVRWMLEKSPDARPASAQAVREALGLPPEPDRMPLPPMGGDSGELSAFAATVVEEAEAAVPRSEIQLAMSVGGAPEAVELQGREAELDELMAIGRKASQVQRSHLVLVQGEAGLGKSRLAQAVRYRLDEEGLFRGARLIQRGGASEDEAVRALLARVLMAERLRGERLAERLEEAGATYRLDPLDVKALTSWLGGETTGQTDLSERADLAARVLRQLSSIRPMALVVEGIEAERGAFLIDLLDELMSSDAARFFMLAPTRSQAAGLPEPAAQLIETLRTEGRVDVLRLGQLPDDVLADMIRPLVDTRADEIAARARGNPLFALELARYRAGATLVGDETATMPLSIGDIWQRRLSEALETAADPALSRAALMAAAILGPLVRRRTVIDIVSQALDRTQEAVESAVDHWIAVEILADDGLRDPTISFVHTLGYEYVVSQVSADSPETTRLLGHLADWIVDRRADMEPELLGRLARQLEERDDPRRAADLALLAGELAVGHLDYGRAEMILRGVADSATAAEEPTIHMRASAELARLHILQGNIAAAEATLGPYRDGMEQTSADGQQVRARIDVLQALASLESDRRRWAAAVSLLRDAARMAEQADEPLALAKVRTQLSQALERAGEMADAERQCRLAIRSLEKSEAPDRLRARAHISLASLCRRQGRIAEADEAAQTARALAEAAGDRRQLDRALAVLLHLADDRGDTEPAISHAEDILRRQRSVGDRLGAARTANVLGVLERHRGALQAAEEYHRESMAALEAQPDPKLFATNVINLGIVLRRRGDLDRAAEHFTRAQDLGGELGDVSLMGWAAVEWARVLRLQNKSRQAEDLLRSILAQLLDEFEQVGAARAQLELGLLAGDQDNWSIARELFSEARGVFADMGRYRDLISAETWLAVSDIELGNEQQAGMAGRRVAERLRDRPVYTRLLSRGLTRLADSLAATDQEVSWRLEDRARRIDDRLDRR